MSGDDGNGMTTSQPNAALVPMLPEDEAARVAADAGMRPEMARIHYFRLLLNSPQVGRVGTELNDRILREGRLTARPEATRLRELAIMRLAWVTSSAYVWAHHFTPTVDVDLAGRRPDNVLAVREGPDNAGFSQAERLTIQAVDEIVRDARVSPGTLAALRGELFDDGELVELCYVIAIWKAITEVMATFDLPLEAAYELWAPDGVSPEDPLGLGSDR
jgi:alkylhydroperoxidase family enzyme